MISESNFINSKSLIAPCIAEHDENMLINSGQNFTIECWFNSTSSLPNQAIFSKGISGIFTQNSGSDYALYYSNNNINFYLYNISSGTPFLSAQNVSQNKWHHVAVARSAGTSKLYVNGIESSSNSSGWSAMGTGNFYIGSSFFNPSSGYDLFYGFIDNFKFTKQCKYENNFGIYRPINEIYLNNPILIDKHVDKNILSLEMNSFNGDSRIFDNSINDFDITNNNVIITSERSKFGASSAYFNGINSYLTIKNNQVFNLFTGDFTIESWAYPQDLNNKYILKHHHSSGDNFGGWSMGISGSRAFFKYGIGNTEEIIVSQSFLSSSWQQIAVSKNNDEIYLVVNGAVNGYRKINTTQISGNSELYIGTDPSGISTRTWNGFIDNIKITRGIAKFIPKFNIPNLGFLHAQKSDPHFNNVTLLMYGNNNNGSTAFSDESRFNVSRLGNGCGYFSGNNTFISLPFSGIGDFKNNNFTIDIWIKPMLIPAANDFMGILNKCTSSNLNNSWRLYLSGENSIPTFEYTINGTSNNQFVQGPSINSYNWNHISVVRNGTAINLYTNGISGLSNQVGSNAIYENNLNLQIGSFEQASLAKIYNGFIEDFRITKNTARYSGNFSQNIPVFYGDNSSEDANYSNVDILLHMNGFQNSNLFQDNSINNYVITGINNCLIKLNNDILTNGTSITNSSSNSIFGGASIFGAGGSTSYLHIPSRYNFANFERNDFTIEWWDNISTFNNGYFPILHYGNDGDYDTAKSRIGVYYSLNGAQLTISMSGNVQNFPINRQISSWQHNAITRKNGIVNLFINGTKHSSEFLMDYNISRGVSISTICAGKYGASLGTLYTMNGFIDDLRVTKNIARYIDDFTPPIEQFANF